MAAVLGVIMLAVSFVGHGNHATVRRVADHVFQLDGCMVDAKPLAEFLVDFAENRIALGSGHVRDLHVRGERVVFRADAP